MKAFWNDCGTGPTPDQAEDVGLREARSIWSDEVRGVGGNFLGLIDEHGRTVQFYYEDDIPDGIDDADGLRIVLMDFPLPERQGSVGRRVTIGEVGRLIETVFAEGADHRRFGAMAFEPW